MPGPLECKLFSGALLLLYGPGPRVVYVAEEAGLRELRGRKETLFAWSNLKSVALQDTVAIVTLVDGGVTALLLGRFTPPQRQEIVRIVESKITKTR